MSCRVFGLEPETVYGEEKTKAQFNLDFDHEVDSMDFKLNDEPVTKSFGSRMNQKARAGVIKPTGSIETSANLQILSHYFWGFLDEYKFTAGSGQNAPNTHEFWGGEHKLLKSFRGVSVNDELVFYLIGLLVDSMKLECSSEDMTLGADFIYKTEFSEILDDEDDYQRVESLVNDLFIMFYDISLKLNGEDPAGIQTSFSFEGSNNHDVDKTIGFGARHPQGQAKANKRENSISIVTTLTKETVRAILDARYGKVNVLEPTKCQILQVPLAVHVDLCEYHEIGLSMDIVFPKCTLLAEFDSSGIDDVEATLNMATLGSDTVELVDGTEVATDMYVKLVNNMPEIGGSGSSP
ncbi:MAG: carboxypeptidase regulatory-like domain-containing protein [Bacilli bacterium]|nr:carboxypeptidase regulatory-like domain-containing protein [Methanobrevibacter sp.]MBR1748264.1 carboxypeptidase regulatory-like domain-containing protein [Bacilli bacterium]